MAGVGKGRVVGTMAALARLAIAAGIGCMIFALAVALILAEGAPLASPELITALGLLGAMWAAGGFVVDRLLRLAGRRPIQPAPPVPPSWHNQHLGRNGRQARPVRRPAPQPSGWWTVLGVAPDAPAATFEAAARGLLRQSHPDRWATADAARRQEAEGRTRTILQALAEARASSR